MKKFKTFLEELNISNLNSPKPKILLAMMTGMWDITKKDLAPLKELAEVDIMEVKSMTEEELAEKCEGYDYLMLNMDFLPFPDPNKMDKLTEKFYEHPATHGLKGINVDMTDADFFSPKIAKEHGILIQDSPNTTTESVAEAAITEILLHARNRHLGYQDQKQGKPAGCRKSLNLKGKKAGVIGHGNIGSRVAELLTAFGMDVMIYEIKEDAGAEITPIEEIFKTAEVISIHIPAHLPEYQQTDEHATNIGFIDSKLLNLCKGTILVNLATDIIVDVDALSKAIKEKKIIGYSVEPGRKMTEKLKQFDVVHISPCSFDSDESRANIKKVWIDNMIATIQGNPTNVWN